MPPRVMIVEDDGVVGLEFKEAVTAAGYEVLGPVRSVAAGLLLARLKGPDVASAGLLRTVRDKTCRAYRRPIGRAAWACISSGTGSWYMAFVTTAYLRGEGWGAPQ